MYPKLTLSPTITFPLSAFSFPEIILNSVVFPAPLGPIIPTIAPGGILNDKLSINNLSPKPLYIFLISITLAPNLSPDGITIC